MNLPQEFIDNVTRTWDKEGTLWLKKLPALIRFFSSQWKLEHIKHFDNLSFNYVAHAHSNLFNAPVVLKIGIPKHDFLNELKALEFYNGNGSVKLLASDGQKYGMLLARVEPGTTLRSFFPQNENAAIQYACAVMKKLHSRQLPSHAGFPSIKNWFSLFNRLEIPLELHHQVKLAHDIVDELQSSAQSLHLLHGDLHHDNILLDASGTGIAIDPKGVIGEAAYEVGAFMCNPTDLSSQPNIPALLEARLEQFSKTLNIDRTRLAKACYARIILSACWTVQAKGNWHDDAAFAEVMSKLFNPSYLCDRDLA